VSDSISPHGCITTEFSPVKTKAPN
jgi:hypothetical protein